MKVKTKTIEGWANSTDYFFNQNTNNDTFKNNLEQYRKKHLKGFKELNTSFDTLRGKNATQKVIIKGWYWRGNWNSPTKKTVTVFYK